MSPISVPAFFLPGVSETDIKNFVMLKFGTGEDSVTLQLPVLTPSLISAIIPELKKTRQEYLSRLPVYDIMKSIDSTVKLWQDPLYHIRREAEALLPIITGYSGTMIKQGLEGLVSMFNKENLEVLLKEELGDPLFLDRFRPRRKIKGMSKAYGPLLTTHVFSGNVPGLPIASLIFALLTKSASLGKAASEEPLFPVLFARSLSEVNPELAKSIAILWWKGGDEEIEGPVFAQSDAVVVYGSEQSVKSVRERVPFTTMFLAYGHKISFGVIGREYLTKNRAGKTAAMAAYDTSIFDQQGCLSPHVFYVEEGGNTSPKEFAALLAGEMDALNQRLPRGKISPGDSAAINQLRGTFEFKEFQDDKAAVYYSSHGTDWTVIYENEPTFVPSCLNRTIRVKPVGDVFEIIPLIEPIKYYLQTVGVALTEKRLTPFADKLGQSGVDRICPLGKMPNPSIGWHHDGRFNLLNFIRWVDIEGVPS